jgi:GTPase SAR1 family protein
MSNITVNVSANSVTVEDVKVAPAVVVDDSIRAAARRRFEQEEAVRTRELTAAVKAERQASAAIESHILEEQVRARVQEEQIRRLAERAVLEAEAKKAALAKEAAIAAEVERLRNRTKAEILEDTIAELKEQVASLKKQKCESCPHCA